MIYVIDASSLIGASKNYIIGKKTFKSVWDTLETLIHNGQLVSSSEIKEEILDEDLKDWLKKFDNFFIPIDDNIQAGVIDILRNHPSLIKLRSTGNSNADPFLIATALSCSTLYHDQVKIVTDEKPSGERIPVVCQEYRITCINLNDFINEVIE